MIFKDDFIQLNMNRYNIDSLGGSSVSIENDMLKFSSGGQWCGVWIQPKIKIPKNTIATIEFDYKITTNHYFSADKSYFAIGSEGEVERDGRYGIRLEKSYFVVIGANSDRGTPSVISLSPKCSGFDPYKPTPDPAVLSLEYPLNTLLHFKITVDGSKKRIYLNINNGEKVLENKIEGFDEFGSGYICEFNSNSYGTRFEYIDNLKISYQDFYHLIKQSDKFYSIKPEYYEGGAFKPITLSSGDYPIKSDFDENGFDNLNDLLRERSEGSISSKSTSLDSGKIFSFDFGSDFKSIVKIE